MVVEKNRNGKSFVVASLYLSVIGFLTGFILIGIIFDIIAIVLAAVYLQYDKKLAIKSLTLSCMGFIFTFILFLIVGLIGINPKLNNTNVLNNVIVEEKQEVKETMEIVETHIYDNAEIKDCMNGLNTEKIGKYSIIYADSKNCTDEVLEDWYFNFVSKNDYIKNIIIYTDSDSLKGCYSYKGIVYKDIELVNIENDSITIGSVIKSMIYNINEKEKSLDLYYNFGEYM